MASAIIVPSGHLPCVSIQPIVFLLSSNQNKKSLQSKSQTIPKKTLSPRCKVALLLSTNTCQIKNFSETAVLLCIDVRKDFHVNGYLGFSSCLTFKVHTFYSLSVVCSKLCTACLRCKMKLHDSLFAELSEVRAFQLPNETLHIAAKSKIHDP